MYVRILVCVMAAGAALLQGCAAGVVVAGGATGAAVAHDQRTAGSVLEDQAIELKIANTIRSDAELNDQSHINVTSYNGLVLLSGETPTDALRKRAEEYARNTQKVRKVYNELVLAAPSSLVSRSGDTVLTTKVKTRMVAEKDFDATRIKVVTENGVVYLMGLVSRDKAAIATQIASETGGVQRVVTLYEYVD